MKNLSVLLVEDNCDDEELAMWVFRKHEHLVVTVARDGLEALRMLRGDERTGSGSTCTPDIIFLDLRLPRIDGLDVLRRIRSDERIASIGVVVLTSSEDPHDRQICKELGVIDFLSKPLTEQVLARLKVV
jgi:two-component system response regulator